MRSMHKRDRESFPSGVCCWNPYFGFNCDTLLGVTHIFSLLTACSCSFSIGLLAVSCSTSCCITASSVPYCLDLTCSRSVTEEQPDVKLIAGALKSMLLLLLFLQLFAERHVSAKSCICTCLPSEPFRLVEAGLQLCCRFNIVTQVKLVL